MGERDCGELGRERAAQRARGVALDDDEFGWRGSKDLEDRLADRADMRMRVILPGAGEAQGCIAAEPVIGRIEQRVLAGKDQQRRNTAGIERADDRGELDCFGTGADDDNDRTGQPSP